MAPEDAEELVDYDEADETYAAPAAVATTNGAKDGEGEKKGSYVGIHSTGFRWVIS
jgi:ATP-dependent RNA helicase UAP56/SUB2